MTYKHSWDNTKHNLFNSVGLMLCVEVIYKLQLYTTKCQPNKKVCTKMLCSIV